MDRLGAIQAKLASQGRLGPVARLLPTTAATTVRKGAEPLVLDGPFAETKEQLLGFYMVEVESIDAAIAIARSLPSVNSVFEVRPVRRYFPAREQ